MNKKLFVLLAVIMVLSMVSCSAPTDSPEGEGDADGVWCYMPVFESIKPITFDPYEGDPGKEFQQVPYVSEWTGIFNGSSTDYGLLIFHILDPNAPSAPMAFVDAAWFAEVEVDGKVGGLGMDAIGDRPDPTADWRGTWVITSGTGELENLRGHGTFWGPGWLPPDGGTDECPEGMGVIYYSGSIHFESE